MKNKTPYEHGVEDGSTMARESGSAVEPANGWDGDLINAVGWGEVKRLFGLGDSEPLVGLSHQAREALNEYRRGCDDGAKAEVASE